MNPAVMQISATVITFNEEANLPRACQSLEGLADEIIIVDSMSTDRTRDVASQFTPHVFVHPFESYSKQKNFASSQASYPWILSLDADEALSEELKATLSKLKTSTMSQDVAAFRCARRARYLGRWIRHSGWYPDFKIRLYDRGRARWVGDYVHESLQVDGRVESLEGDLLHFTANSISDHVARLNRYTSLAARQSAAEGKHFSILRCSFIPPFTFIKSYIFQAGVLDGWRGLLIAFFAAWYVFLKQIKLWEMTRNKIS